MISYHLSLPIVTVLFCFVFLVMRDFKIYSFGNFQIFNTGLLTTVFMLCITFPSLNSFITWSHDLLTVFIHFSYLQCPSSGNHRPVSLSLVFIVAVIVIFPSTYKWDHKILVSLRLTSLSIMPSRFNHVVSSSKISFFLWLNNIPLIPPFLSIHPSVNT